MWFGGNDEINMNNMNLNSATMNPMTAMGMNPNFNLNNHDPFDFSLHSSSMQQGTESSSAILSVSIIATTQLIYFSSYQFWWF